VLSHKRKRALGGFPCEFVWEIVEVPQRELRQRRLMRYLTIMICLDGRRVNVGVHLFVLDAYIGPRPTPDAEGRHLDDDPDNNRLDNLAWGSAFDNAADRRRNGGYRSEDNGRARLSFGEAEVIRQRAAHGETLVSLARAFSVHQRQIGRIVRRESWQGKGEIRG
jgi:hypothetical protein